MSARRFECTVYGHNKFWIVTGPDRAATGIYRVTTTWGAMGTGGQSKTKVFGSWSDAEAFINTKVAEKLGKGYVEIGGDETETVVETAHLGYPAVGKVEKTETPIRRPKEEAPAWGERRIRLGEK